MSRLGFNHMAWSKSVTGRLAHDLADSAVATPDLAALGLPHTVTLPGLKTGVPRQLETALAARLQAPGGRVLVTAGASEANAAAIAGLAGAGETVLVERPGYEPHRALVKLFGGRLRTFTRATGPNARGVAEAVAAELTRDTRLVVLTHLHNPSGAALDADDAQALDQLADQHGFWILCDETFRDADFGSPIGTYASFGPRWVATGSLTKAYGLGGIRIGWVAGGEEALRRAQDAVNGLSAEPSIPSVVLALALLPHLDTLRERGHDILRRNHARWETFVTARRELIGGSVGFDAPPRGTTTWVRLGSEGEGDELSALAASKFDLAITPGGFFGDTRGVRVGIGVDPERFEAALPAFGRCLEAFRSSRVKSAS